MKWVWLLLFVLLLPQGLAATSMSCPSSVEQNAEFSITVANTAASLVGLYFGPNLENKSGTSRTWIVSEDTLGDVRFWGNSYVNNQWINDGANCVVYVNAPAPDNPGTVSISVTPTSVEYGQSVSISTSFTDADGTDEIRVREG